jgi:ABC-type uncharacterized transport system permease subunit
LKIIAAILEQSVIERNLEHLWLMADQEPQRPDPARGGRVARIGACAGLYPGRRIRFAAVLAGGALCGVAGCYISIIYTPLWVEGMVAGKGWIALALTTFATWRPARVLLGAYVFGGVTMLQFLLKGRGVDVPSQFLVMLPYLATILVLVLNSRNAAWIRANMPVSPGKPLSPGGGEGRLRRAACMAARACVPRVAACGFTHHPT